MKKLTIIVVLIFGMNLIFNSCTTNCPTLDKHLTVSLQSDQILFTNTSTSTVRFIIFSQNQAFNGSGSPILPAIYFPLQDFTLRAGESFLNIRKYDPSAPADRSVFIGIPVDNGITPAVPFALTGAIPNTAFGSCNRVSYGSTCQYNGIVSTTIP